MTAVFAARSCVTLTPSRRRLSAITCVSWLSRTPVSVVFPFARAARMNARFVMLFEPGGRIDPRTGPATG